ncbi:MAG TPA: hypothetical protein PLD46_05005, partial [Hyphomicrobium sp.]|nr:hypothetical protein [Hyphomicrobium sp.]
FPSNPALIMCRPALRSAIIRLGQLDVWNADGKDAQNGKTDQYDFHQLQGLLADHIVVGKSR